MFSKNKYIYLVIFSIQAHCTKNRWKEVKTTMVEIDFKLMS